MYRRARFIWTPRQAIDASITFGSLLRRGPARRIDGVNRWFLFRRRIDLPAAPDAAHLHITADSRYRLFINGRHVGRGPVRSASTHIRVDQYDCASYLEEGENVVAVLVHVYGADTAWYETARDYWQTIFGDGALYVDATIRCGASILEVPGDERWRCVPSQAWDANTPRSGWGQGFIEDHDARLMPEGWADRGYDDSGWGSARPQVRMPTADEHAKGWGAVEPFPTLLPREIPMLLESAKAPERVLGVYAVRRNMALPLDRRPYEEPFEPAPDGCVSGLDALLIDDDSCTLVRTSADRDIALLIGFDARHAGYPFIDIDAAGGEIVEVAVSETVPGEYRAAPGIVPRLARASQLDCAHVFRYTARPGRQRFEKFDWTGVKFLQLVVRNAPRGLRIRHVGSIYTHYPAEYRGAFECSDSSLNRLWEIGRYTTLQCTHDAWEDCPGREKRQWLGDGVVHYLVSAAAFGPSTQAIDRQFLIQATESQRADGLMQMFAPGDHHGSGITIPDFTLHWICAVRDHFMHTSDVDTVLRVLPALQRAVEWFERQRGPNGLLANVPHWHFIEWARVGRAGESFVINAMLAGALDAGAALARAAGYERLAADYDGRAESLRSALRTRHWDARRGVFVDSVNPETGEQHAQVSQHANAAAIVWNVAAEESWPGIVAMITDPRRLRLTATPPVTLREEPFDPAEHIVQANTFFSHFVYCALSKARRVDLMLAAIRVDYAAMLEARSETLWESGEPSASLCHAFSATPVHQLSAHVLGVAPATPGFERARIAPQVADLAFARGAYPTVRGDIRVEWSRTAGKLDVSIWLPEGVEADFVPPDGYLPSAALRCTGSCHFALRSPPAKVP